MPTVAILQINCIGVHLFGIAIGKLSVLDLAEVNPKLGSNDDQKKTLDSAIKVVAGWGAGVADVRRVRPIG